jgi:probable rRNA maturation factor
MSSDKSQPEIVVHLTRNFKDINVSLSKLKKLVKNILDARYLMLDARRASKTVVSIAIVGDAEIRKMNKEFLNRNRTTDVISFDLSDANLKLFELVVNGERAVRQAKPRGHSSEAELALYVTHGLLHNLGFDDSTKKKAQKMHRAEDEILQQLGYGLVYNKSASESRGQK